MGNLAGSATWRPICTTMTGFDVSAIWWPIWALWSGLDISAPWRPIWAVWAGVYMSAPWWLIWASWAMLGEGKVDEGWRRVKVGGRRWVGSRLVARGGLSQGGRGKKIIVDKG